MQNTIKSKIDFILGEWQQYFLTEVISMNKRIKWNINKHLVSCIIITFLYGFFDLIFPLILSLVKSNASIAIIGGADGPTQIHTSFTLVEPWLFVFNKYLITFIILMILYKPVSYLVNNVMLKKGNNMN